MLGCTTNCVTRGAKVAAKFAGKVLAKIAEMKGIQLADNKILKLNLFAVLIIGWL